MVSGPKMEARRPKKYHPGARPLWVPTMQLQILEREKERGRNEQVSVSERMHESMRWMFSECEVLLLVLYFF